MIAAMLHVWAAFTSEFQNTAVSPPFLLSSSHPNVAGRNVALLSGVLERHRCQWRAVPSRQGYWGKRQATDSMGKMEKLQEQMWEKWRSLLLEHLPKISGPRMPNKTDLESQLSFRSVFDLATQKYRRGKRRRTTTTPPPPPTTTTTTTTTRTRTRTRRRTTTMTPTTPRHSFFCGQAWPLAAPPLARSMSPWTMLRPVVSEELYRLFQLELQTNKDKSNAIAKKIKEGILKSHWENSVDLSLIGWEMSRWILLICAGKVACIHPEGSQSHQSDAAGLW